MLILVVIASVLFVGLFFKGFFNNQKKVGIVNRNTQRSFINPPFNGISEPYSSYTLNSDSGKLILLASGTRIFIPPFAFVDEKGNAVQGYFTISYREFHDILDCFVSGIPMEYDSSGKKFDLETAGMFEIKSYQGNNQLFFKSGKSIRVEMLSSRRTNGFNLYKLDTVQRNWIYYNKNKFLNKLGKDLTAAEESKGDWGRDNVDTGYSSVNPLGTARDTAGNWDSSASERVTIVFEISGFGIYNCDCPHHFKNPVSLLATMTDRVHNDINVSESFLLDRTSNYIHVFYMEDSKTINPLMFDPSDRNTLFCILKGNKIAVYKDNSFDPLKVGGIKSANLVMDMPEGKFHSINDVKDFLLRVLE